MLNSTTMEGQFPNEKQPSSTGEITNAKQSKTNQEEKPLLSTEMVDKMGTAVQETRDGVNHAIDFAFHLYFQLIKWYINEKADGERGKVSQLGQKAKEYEKKQTILTIMEQIKEVAKKDGYPDFPENQLRELAENALRQIEALQRENEEKEQARIKKEEEKKDKRRKRMKRKLVVERQRYPVVKPDTSMETPRSKSAIKKRKPLQQRSPHKGKGFDKSHKPYYGGRNTRREAS